MSRLRLILGAAAPLAAGLGVLALAGWLSDPFGWRAGRLKTAETAATAIVSARTLEAEGARAAVERLAAAHLIQLETRAATVEAAALARSAEDANQPLEPGRAARLREHDRRLCQLVPASCDAAATGAAAGGG